MLQQIDLQFFKCFALLKLPVGPLTLLSGANASGKSSVMQALVLLHQTVRDHEWSTRLMLNGTSIRLGTASAVIDDVFGRRTCAIALLDGDTAYEWDFAGDRDEMSMAVERVRVRGSEEREPQFLRNLLPVDFDEPQWADSLVGRLSRLTYLTAERLGPREHYALEDPQRTPVVGPTGEHAASVLYWGGDRACSGFAGGSRRTPDPSPPGRSAHGAVLSRLRPRRGEGSVCQCRSGSGEEASFSDSSDSEKRGFRARLTFPHPDKPGESMFCTWHGKVRHMMLRLHFSWPVRADEPVYVVYAGPKLTKR